MAAIVATVVLHNTAYNENEHDPPVNRREKNAINIVNQDFDDIAQQVNNININNIIRTLNKFSLFFK